MLDTLHAYYFTKGWYQCEKHDAYWELTTNITPQQLAARPADSKGRDANGNIAPFANAKEMWAFIKSMSRRIK